MWNLEVVERGSSKSWQRVGTYGSLKEAAKEIIRLENIPVTGLFLQASVETNFGEDDEFLSLLTYDGEKFLYTVKKSRQ